MHGYGYYGGLCCACGVVHGYTGAGGRAEDGWMPPYTHGSVSQMNGYHYSETIRAAPTIGCRGIRVPRQGIREARGRAVVDVVPVIPVTVVLCCCGC